MGQNQAEYRPRHRDRGLPGTAAIERWTWCPENTWILRIGFFSVYKVCHRDEKEVGMNPLAVVLGVSDVAIWAIAILRSVQAMAA